MADAAGKSLEAGLGGLLSRLLPPCVGDISSTIEVLAIAIGVRFAASDNH